MKGLDWVSGIEKRLLYTFQARRTWLEYLKALFLIECK